MPTLPTPGRSTIGMLLLPLPLDAHCASVLVSAVLRAKANSSPVGPTSMAELCSTSPASSTKPSSTYAERVCATLAAHWYVGPSIGSATSAASWGVSQMYPVKASSGKTRRSMLPMGASLSNRVALAIDSFTRPCSACICRTANVRLVLCIWGIIGRGRAPRLETPRAEGPRSTWLVVAFIWYCRLSSRQSASSVAALNGTLPMLDILDESRIAHSTSPPLPPTS
eukprot:scaffold127259_cov69-Phaeocystis_antarctica.AAC.1